MEHTSTGQMKLGAISGLLEVFESELKDAVIKELKDEGVLPR